MQTRHTSASARIMGVFLVIVLFLPCAFAQTEKILYTFMGRGDGAQPVAGLALDSAGNLYGPAAGGGDPACVSNGLVGCGVIFELSPGSNGSWMQKVLYTFHGGSDGAYPNSRVIFDKFGNLYGTTEGGGGDGCYGQGCGTVFELSRQRDGTWAETILYQFQGSTNGYVIPEELAFDNSGNLFGTTVYGGDPACYNQFFPFGCGTIFELSPSGNTWVFTVLHSFAGTDGANPVGKLWFDGQANFYGSTESGGPGCSVFGCGVLFELSPSASGWLETVLYDFDENQLLGVNTGIIADKEGRFFGTTFNGGLGDGDIFVIRNFEGQVDAVVLYKFNGAYSPGTNPSAPPTFGKGEDLYGTTRWGGNDVNCSCGTVYHLVRVGNSWQETMLHSFSGGADGEEPSSTVTLDDAGNIFGSTPFGGTGSCSNLSNGPGCGILFEITP